SDARHRHAGAGGVRGRPCRVAAEDTALPPRRGGAGRRDRLQGALSRAEGRGGAGAPGGTDRRLAAVRAAEPERPQRQLLVRRDGGGVSTTRPARRSQRIAATNRSSACVTSASCERNTK